LPYKGEKCLAARDLTKRHNGSSRPPPKKTLRNQRPKCKPGFRHQEVKNTELILWANNRIIRGDFKTCRMTVHKKRECGM